MRICAKDTVICLIGNRKKKSHFKEHKAVSSVRKTDRAAWRILLWVQTELLHCTVARRHGLYFLQGFEII